VSIRLETFDRSRHRQELRRYTDLELILAGRQLRSLIENEKNIVSPFGEPAGSWELGIEDAMAEWRSRQKSGGPVSAYASATLRAARQSRPGHGCGKHPDMRSGSRVDCEPGAPCGKTSLASPDTNGRCRRFGGPGCIGGHSPAPTSRNFCFLETSPDGDGGPAARSEFRKGLKFIGLEYQEYKQLAKTDAGWYGTPHFLVLGA
jgi:hypothetical protein